MNDEALSACSRVLVAVAHPDDETFATGSLLLHLAAAGVQTAVCCATRGESGTLHHGVVVPDSGIAELRERELRAAARVLGVGPVHLLDLLDSGMTGPPPDGSLVTTNATTTADLLAGVVEAVGPDAVVTLDGSDGHRDHIRMREVAENVGRRLGVPIWLHCLPRRLMRRWAELMARQNPKSPYLALGELGTPDEDITDRIDTSDHYAARWEAIALHASQTSPFEDLPEDLQWEFLTTECLRSPAAG